MCVWHLPSPGRCKGSPSIAIYKCAELIKKQTDRRGPSIAVAATALMVAATTTVVVVDNLSRRPAVIAAIAEGRERRREAVAAVAVGVAGRRAGVGLRLRPQYGGIDAATTTTTYSSSSSNSSEENGCTRGRRGPGGLRGQLSHSLQPPYQRWLPRCRNSRGRSGWRCCWRWGWCTALLLLLCIPWRGGR